MKNTSIMNGFAIIISGPSGVGKGTVIQHLRRIRTDLGISVSFSTRAPREHETDGVHYHFISNELFSQKIEKDEFVEWAQVHGNRYGTAWDSLKRLHQGEKVIFEVDVQGARKLIRFCADNRYDAVSVFLAPPSMTALRERLKGRGTEEEREMDLRLRTAGREICHESAFNYTITNDRIEHTVQKIMEIISKKERFMQRRYNKFLFTHAVSRRAKDIVEEGTYLLDEAQRDNRPIMEAIKEMELGLIDIVMLEDVKDEIKEEDDLLDGLYEDIKLPAQQFALKTKTVPSESERELATFIAQETGISVAELEVEDQLAEDELAVDVEDIEEDEEADEADAEPSESSEDEVIAGVEEPV